jgi:signal transduction histidine kinase
MIPWDPTLEREGLLAALKKRADLIGHGCIQVHGDVWEPLPPETEGILCRVGQEAMDNAVKHSGVMEAPSIQIDVTLERGDSYARLCVCDDGVGFDVEEVLTQQYKWGLRRLRDTLRQMGGSLALDSAPGKGTTVCATVNLSQDSYGE